MAVVALRPGYTGEVADREANFHGNRLVYVHWEGHLNYCAPLCFPLPPAMPFGALVSDVMGPIYSLDPAWAGVGWDRARWTLDGVRFSPDFARGLGEQGVGHKSVLRFWTEGASGARP